ncbi:MAG: hypothetical protein KC933_12895 [Myxococcales bacterium]|nr:hypothetical protein [Myxococcales bacterium]
MGRVERNTLIIILTASALALGGCSGDRRSNAPRGVKKPDSGIAADTGVSVDSGAEDSGVTELPDTGLPGPDSGMSADAGLPDSGMADSGVTDSGVPPGPCPAGTEGCACASTIGPNDTAFLQDDCQSSLLCVPWDVLSGRTDLTGPVQSCVRPCSVNSDCGVGQVCGDSGFDAASGAPRICMDRQAQFDEFCGLSRSLVSRVPNVSLNTAGSIVGCGGTSTCVTGVFSDISPDEGVCLSFCQSNADCGGATPYCNPGMFIDANGQPLGVCSTGKYGQGQVCGTTDLSKVGVASRCDSAADAHPNLSCIGTPDVPSGKGVCIALCNNTTDPCRSTGPSGLVQTCTAFPEIFPVGSDFTGLCSVACDNFPDKCTGTGGQGAGQYCSGAFQFSQTGNAFSLCADRYGPSWTLSTFDSTAQLVSVGDNCVSDATRCPEPSACLGDGAGGGLCAIGCDTTGAAPTCAQLTGSGTAVCATLSAPAGLCGDN